MKNLKPTADEVRFIRDRGYGMHESQNIVQGEKLRSALAMAENWKDVKDVLSVVVEKLYPKTYIK